MSENSNTQPYKSILKRKTNSGTTTTSTSKAPGSSKADKNKTCPAPHAKFDEANIKNTYHPADKDYGFIKIDEPKTPFNDYKDPVDESKSNEKRSSLEESPNNTALDPAVLSKMLMEKGHELPKSVANLVSQDHKEEFESQRKAHYNEFKAVPLDKELIDQEEDDSSQAGQNSAPTKISRHRDSRKLMVDKKK